MESCITSTDYTIICRIYTDHGERKFLFCLVELKGKPALAFIKNDVLAGYIYLDKILQTVFSRSKTA